MHNMSKATIRDFDDRFTSVKPPASTKIVANLSELLSPEHTLLTPEEKSNITEIIESNPVLSSLRSADKLSFGMSHRKKFEVMAAAPKKKKAKKLPDPAAILHPKDDTPVSEVIIQSLNYFCVKHNELTQPQKEYLDILNGKLIESSMIQSSGAMSSSFETLTLEYFPNLTREKGKISSADYYSHTEQSLEICSSPLRDKHYSENLMRVLVHEGTHAIDDIYHDNISSESIMRSFSKVTSKTTLRALADDASVIADDTKTLKTEYVDELLEKNSIRRIKSDVAHIDGLDKTPDGGLPYRYMTSEDSKLVFSPTYSEFLAFHSERVFDALGGTIVN